MSTTNNFDIVVIGAGPVGLTAAALASVYGLKTLIVDREAVPFPLPRAIHMNGDVVRVLRAAGISHLIRPQLAIQRGLKIYGADRKLNMIVKRKDDPDATGLSSQYAFYQPTLEAILRDKLTQSNQVEMRLGCELVSFEQSADNVDLVLAKGEDKVSCSAKFIVACDGARSTVRRLLNIEMDDFGAEDFWVVVDFFIDERSELPCDFVHLYCEPKSPAVYVPGPGQHRRIEWMLRPGDQPQLYAQRKKVEKTLENWITLEHAEVIRHATYQFRSLIAQKWRDGRIFLAGDAAHLTPPFMGQGMGHGLRDVSNLLWKLNQAIRCNVKEDFLDSYQLERAPHVQSIIKHVIGVGKMIALADVPAASARDKAMREQTGLSSDEDKPVRLGKSFSTTDLYAGFEFPQLWLHYQGVKVRMDDLVKDSALLITRGDPMPEAIAAIKENKNLFWIGNFSQADFVLLDTDGQESGIFNWLDEAKADAVLVRPDKYIYGHTKLDKLHILIKNYESWTS